MPVTANVNVTLYQTPKEAEAAVAAIVAALGSAEHEINVLMYGLNHPVLIDALIAAHQRGVMVRACLDHTQACAPHEIAQLHRLMLSIPPAQFRIGTSPVKHQILHRKSATIDALITIDGSFNWTTEAPDQANSVNVVTSADYTAPVDAEFEELWAYITANEEAYQKLAA